MARRCALLPKSTLIEDVISTMPGEPSTPTKPSGPIQLAKGVIGTVGEALRIGYDMGLIDMIDRLRKASPNRTVQEGADAARRTVDDHKRLAGQMSQPLKNVLNRVSRAPWTRLGRATMSLQRAQRTGRMAKSRFWAYADGEISRDQLTAAERQIVDSLTELNDAAGQIMQDNGMTTKMPDGREVPFKKTGRFPRVTTLFAYDILADGAGIRMQELARLISEMNNLDINQVRGQLLQARKQMVMQEDVGEDHAQLRRINAEFAHTWDKFPSHMVDPQTGSTIELLESNLYSYSRAMVSQTAARTSYRRNFGKESDQDSLISRLERETAAAPRHVQERVKELVRTLHDLPADRSFWIRPAPGTRLHQVGLALRHISNAYKGGVLGPTFIANMFEPFGNIATLAGGWHRPEFWRAWWRSIPGTRRHKEFRALLESIGAVDVWVRNWAWNPARPGESFSRISREVNTATVRGFWRQQEIMPALLALDAVERMQAGRGTAQDIQNVMTLLDVDESVARQMARGQLDDPDMYLAFARRAGAYTTNSPMMRSEQARIENERLFQSGVAFTRYAFVSVRAVAQRLPRSWRTLQAAKDEPTRENIQRVAEEVKWWGSLVTGKTIAGTLAHFMFAVLTGGKSGLEIAVEEALDDIPQFLLDSFLYTMFAGPFGAILRDARDPHRLYGQWGLQYVWPMTVMAETSEALMGMGRYSDTGALTRIQMLSDRYFPLRPMAANVLGTVGLIEHDTGRDQAIRAFWRARRDIDPMGRWAPAPGYDEFRRHMRDAHRAMRWHRDPADALNRAFEYAAAEERPERVRQSLLARRLLLGPFGDPNTEEYRKLKNRIGASAMEELHKHDQLLEMWADAYQ